MKKVIVLGATGTVGAYACLQLKADGFEVIAVGSRPSDGGFFGKLGMEYCSVDISRPEAFAQLPRSGVYALVHLAGMLPARMEGYVPQRYIDINVSGTLNLLEYAVSAGVQRLVYAQSISDVDYLCGSLTPIPEDAPSHFPLDNDHSVYSISKNAAADLIRHYAQHYGFRAYILRFPNIYLYHPNPYYYVNGQKRMQGYRAMIYKALKGEDIEIWGNPQKKRDIVYVKDCTQLLSLCLSVADAPGGNYNVGTGQGVSLEEQVRGIVQVFSPKDRPSRILYNPDKPDAAEYIFDISNGVKYLGYQPRYTYLAYLEDFKEEMQRQRFAALWGTETIL